ncbi:sensor histidine kinase [Ktedonosporobacter rubrisoli]|uniref:histidine kinase n=1 Tax=Ktedonosporobacter rubrisoli TaxID=2509675 RepID=A0A4P6JZP6_KTERU|nr:sensor histidine kinase [Ktedonosporobacter rubrisoli]QBD80972.1 sensor histidine kinase [Ktedonosporobacter rubrisoli]
MVIAMQKEQILQNRMLSSRFWSFIFPPSTLGTSILCLLALIVGLAWLLAHALWLSIFLYCAAILALLFLDRIEYWRYGQKEQTPRRAALVLLALRLLCSAIAVLCAPEFALILYLVQPFFALSYFGRKAAYATVCVISVLYLLEIWLDPRADHRLLAIFLEGYIFVLACIGCVVMIRNVALEMESRQREQASRLQAEALLEEVQESRRQLQIYARQVADLATLEERNRIAREIHDSLGHSLIAITLQLEKALAYHTVAPEESQQAMSDARQVARSALQDVRHSVRALRSAEERFSCVRGVETLVEQHRKSGLNVKLTLEGQEEHFSQQVLLMFYRVVQEGLTNIQKHARARKAEVRLCFTQEQASLVISDDGIGFAAASWLATEGDHADGYGLRGIQERVNQLGATFQIESAPARGTRLTVQVRETHAEVME